VLGVSLGGMIAQQLTIDHPGRVRSLCSIMSMTGDRSVGGSTPEAAAALGRPPAASRAEAIEKQVAASRIIGSPAYPAPEEETWATTCPGHCGRASSMPPAATPTVLPLDR
jgi:pimeloyl-ACP methyl ester carboxylesterase